MNPAQRRSADALASAPPPGPAKASPVLHPLAFALYSILALLAANLQELDPAEAIRPLLLTALASMLLLGLLRLVLGDWHRAGVAASALLLLFFSYGHIYTTLERVSLAGVILGRHRYLLPIALVLSTALIAWLWRRRPDMRRATLVLNVVGGVALVFPLATMAVSAVRGAAQGRSSQPTEVIRLTPIEGEPLPDIYYIILDSYARADYMQGLFGYDNSEFIDFLESRGFYVAEQSHCNHNWTGLSLASSLNMEFVQDLGLPLLPGSYPGVVTSSIRDSRVRRALEQIGYQTVAMRSGWTPTEIIDASTYYAPSEVNLSRLRGPISLNRFETQVLQTSVMLAWIDKYGGPWRNWVAQLEDFPHEELRAIVLAEFANLSLPAADPQPQFVFAHIIPPHRPFLFGPNGEALAPQTGFTLAASPLTTQEEVAAYRDQAIFVSRRMMQTIDSILQLSAAPPIIIIQADHGSWQDASDVPQRTAILLAILLPEACRSQLYPTMTPVNTFRVLFNCRFGTALPLLEDRVYFTASPRKNLNDFRDVTELVRGTYGEP